MGTMASQITSRLFTPSFIQVQIKKKHQSSASLACVWGIHLWPVNSPHKGPLTRKMFPINDVIMCQSMQCSTNPPSWCLRWVKLCFRWVKIFKTFWNCVLLVRIFLRMGDMESLCRTLSCHPAISLHLQDRHIQHIKMLCMLKLFEKYVNNTII